MASQTSTAPMNWRIYEALDLDPVLDAALGQFAQKGYHGTSVRDIAHASERSISSIYNRYPSKQHMLIRLFEMMLSDLSTRLEAAIATSASIVVQFECAVECLVLFHKCRQQLAFVALSELRSLEDDAVQEIAVQRRRIQAVVDDIVRRGVAGGLFCVTDPVRVSRAVVRVCITLAQEPSVAEDLQELSEAYIEIALRMVNHKA